MLTRSDVDAARGRIRPHVRRTPLLQVSDRLWLKCEYLQTTGSFKARGAFNRILAAAEEGRLRPEVGDEILESEPSVDTVVVAVGDAARTCGGHDTFRTSPRSRSAP